MNYMGKGKNSSHGYYSEENDLGDIGTTSPTNRRAEELDLMDSSPVHHHPENNITIGDDEREIGGSYSGGALGLGTGTMAVVEREHMFDKVVTPSDVGKLNRLVIPKQHAEKYFPLDSSTNDKGLILNFEDSNGKSWRFRYSYWNSSQSYVMTKGWSRFVKDKKLDPGDIVSFHRGKGHLAKDQLFIDWRRRLDHPSNPNTDRLPSFPLHPAQPYYFPARRNFQRSVTVATGWSSTGLPPPGTIFLRGGDHYYHPRQNTNYRTSIAYDYGRSNNSTTPTIANEAAYGGNRGGATHHHLLNNPDPSGNSLIYLKSAPISPYHQQVALEVETMQFSSSGGRHDFGGVVNQEVFLPSVPVVPGKAAAKRLRLFGVNMDCPISDSSEDDDEEHDNTILPSTTIGYHLQTLMAPPHLSNSVQLRLYNTGASSSPQVLPPHHQMQFHSDYLVHDKGKGIE